MDPELAARYPSVPYLAESARRRIPHFAWEFLASGTGTDACVRRNRAALDAVTLVPEFMKGALEPQLDTELLGVRYAVPFGVSPVGLSSLIWPGMEKILARSAARHRFPYSLSTFSQSAPETIGPLAAGMGWFQLYPPRSANMRDDLLARAHGAGFTTLLVTADVPVASRRERQVRSGLAAPPRMTPRIAAACAVRPAWTLATLRTGVPRFAALERYAGAAEMRDVFGFLGREFGGALDWRYLEEVRARWEGPILLKGVLDTREARRAVEIGLDGVVVSNHGGRQFDGAPASISVLPAIREAVGASAKVLFDSGVSSGLDIARALALGADFVLLGRAFMLAVAALGERGGDHAAAVLREDLRNNMIQLGCRTVAELSARVPAGGADTTSRSSAGQEGRS